MTSASWAAFSRPASARTPPARLPSTAALPPEAGALTVNQVCGSGFKAVALAAQAIQTGNAEIIVAGGMESMTNAPYLLPQARAGYRMGNGTLVDSMIYDGLWDAYNDFHMGVAAEMIAAKYGITREEQDAFAAESHRRAAAATAQGFFRDEILPVEIPPAKKASHRRTLRCRRVHPSRNHRRNSCPTQARLSKQVARSLRATLPASATEPQPLVVMSAERARELGLKPLAVIRAQATSGREPEWFSLAPIEAVRKVAAKAGWPLVHVDLFELNEAFSVQALAVNRDLGLDPAKVNVHGGAVAIGHPIGASGARVLVTLLYAMQRYGKNRRHRRALPRRWQCGRPGCRTGLGPHPTGFPMPLELSDIEQ